VYIIAYFSLSSFHDLWAMIGRSTLFIMLFIAAIYKRNISPDFLPIIETVLKRIGIKKKD
jgi:hypothetical protein